MTTTRTPKDLYRFQDNCLKLGQAILEMKLAMNTTSTYVRSADGDSATYFGVAAVSDKFPELTATFDQNDGFLAVMKNGKEITRSDFNIQYLGVSGSDHQFFAKLHESLYMGFTIQRVAIACALFELAIQYENEINQPPKGGLRPGEIYIRSAFVNPLRTAFGVGKIRV